MAVEPTENINASQIHYPYLRKRLALTSDDDSRIDNVVHEDKITVSISPAGYGMTFINSEPFGTGGVLWFLQPGSGEESGESAEKRREKVMEKLVRNCSWMRDARREDVDGTKESWKRDLEGRERVDGEEDVDMEEA